MAAIGALLLGSLAGCGGPSEAEADTKAQTTEAPADGPLTLSVRNQTAGKIKNVGAKFGVSASFGDVARGATDTLKSKSIRAEGKVGVYWMDSRGESYGKEWKAERALGKDYRGSILITIRDHGEASIAKR
ncbi:MAG: hypothetical protein AAF288_13920 [Planctomycetota bacterium]